MHDLEKLAQELTKKAGAPIEVTRAGLVVLAFYLKEIDMNDEQMRGAVTSAQRILDHYYRHRVAH